MTQPYTCFSSLWHQTSNPSFGNCYTFNTKYNTGEDNDFPRKATLTGAYNGIGLELPWAQEA